MHWSTPLTASSSRSDRIIWVIEPAALARACLAAFLSREFADYRVAEAACANSFLSDPTSRSAALVIVGATHSSPGTAGETIEAINRRAPLVPVVAFVGEADGADGLADRHNLRAVVQVSVVTTIAVSAVRIVLAGGSYFAAPRSVPATRSVDAPPEAQRYGLTHREAQVLEGLRRGGSNKSIARELGLSENTVKVHVRQIIRKLKVENRTQAAVTARANLTLALD